MVYEWEIDPDAPGDGGAASSSAEACPPRVYSWEVEPDSPSFPSAPAPITDDMPFCFFDANDDAPDFDTVTAEEAGAHLYDYLLELKHKAVLSSKQTCVLAFWAAKAGAIGPIDKLAYKPSAQSGHFARHLRSATGSQQEDNRLYPLTVPGYVKAADERAPLEIPITPIHESLFEEISSDPSILETVAKHRAEKKFPPRFYNHPVVTASDEATPIVPYSLYLDGLPYNHWDGVLGIFVYITTTMKRHLVATVRKRDLCKCGCGGNCTYYPIFAAIRWSMQVAASGVYPAARHNGVAFGGSTAEALRAAKANQDVGFKCVLLYFKGDWSEYCSTLSVPTWKSDEHGCLFCDASKADYYKVDGFNPGSFPHVRQTSESWEAACRACEIRIWLNTKEELIDVASSLFYCPKRRGRIVGDNYPLLGLQYGDRLEPFEGLEDHALFESLHPPCAALFWRISAETSVKRRTSILDPAIGVGIEAVMVDTLHCLHLGILQRYVSDTWWHFILADGFGTGATSEPELLRLSVSCLRRLYAPWLRGWRTANPGERRSSTEVPHIGVSTLGGKLGHQLKMKAMMTRPLVPFTVHLLTTHPGKIASQVRMVAAGEALEKLIRLTRLRGQPSVRTLQVPLPTSPSSPPPPSPSSPNNVPSTDPRPTAVGHPSTPHAQPPPPTHPFPIPMCSTCIAGMSIGFVRCIQDAASHVEGVGVAPGTQASHASAFGGQDISQSA